MVVVPDDQLSLAIGREGQNVRLAHKLTGWKIDIKSVSQMEKTEAANFEYNDDVQETQEDVEEQSELDQEIEEEMNQQVLDEEDLNPSDDTQEEPEESEEEI